MFDASAIENVLKRLYSLFMQNEAELVWKEFVSEESEGVPANVMFLIMDYIIAYSGVRAIEFLTSIFSELNNRPEPNLREFVDQQEYRVKSFARTETTRAMNQGALTAMRNSGLSWEKSWVAVRDEVTRNAHAVKSPTDFIGLDQAFEVGGESLMYPADRSLGATAKNIINCRCSMDFRIARGAAL